MTENEKIKIKCLELALASPSHHGTPLEIAKQYYTFLKEKDGINVINAVSKFKKKDVKLLS